MFGMHNMLRDVFLFDRPECAETDMERYIRDDDAGFTELIQDLFRKMKTCGRRRGGLPGRGTEKRCGACAETDG